MEPVVSQIVDELEEDVTILQALLNAATGVWFSDCEDEGNGEPVTK